MMYALAAEGGTWIARTLLPELGMSLQINRYAITVLIVLEMPHPEDRVIEGDN
jgi:hypothetical protein